jgi:NAD(P)H-dependent flavin oxidoreductase YrpB (nitropropane dioxygenase family)
MLRTDLVDALERSGRIRTFGRAVRRAAGFRRLSGLTWRQLVRDGLALRHGRELSWSQVLLAANTPMLLKSAMVDGRTDLGVMAAGQVAGVIDDLPSCAELVERIVREAEEVLTVLEGLRAVR